MSQQIQKATNEARDIRGFFEIDEGLKKSFIKLLGLMKNDGVRVILYFPPYHPFAYDYYTHSNEYKIINDVETFLRNTSAEYGLTLVGSYNPHQLSIPETSFFDDVHLRDITQLKRIFSPLLMKAELKPEIF